MKGRPTVFDVIVRTLADKVFANKKISLAEEQLACGIVQNLRNIKEEITIDIYDCCSCKSYLFQDRNFYIHHCLRLYIEF
jgi:hypothetical protein